MARAEGTGTLGKAMEVLEVVAQSSSPLRFTDVLHLLDQPRGTLHRQISNLIEEGLLATRADNSYELGLKLLKFASHAWSSNQFRTVAEPHLSRLHDTTGETVHLGILNGTEVIYLDKVESRQAVRMYSQIGNAAPAFCTGVGKAALAALPDEELERRIGRIEFRRFTDTTLADRKALSAEIAAIRDCGNAFDREEHESDIHCVAAPIHSGDRSFVAGISVTAPVYRVDMDQLIRWGPLVREAAAAIMDDMANRLGPRA